MSRAATSWTRPRCCAPPTTRRARCFGLTKPLLRIDPSAAPNGTADVTGHVTALRQLPLRLLRELRGGGRRLDRRTGTLRVIVVSPGFCVITDSKTYKFTRG
ncbi:hypothetical protein STENM327S_05807 [Streptomyces tendae]